MRHLYLYLALLSLAWTPLPARSLFQYSVISSKELKKKIQGPCVFLHYWAAWCEICVKELPMLMSFLKTKQSFEPVIVDLSAELAQEKFSSPWLRKIAAESKTFRKGKFRDRDLIAVVEPHWDGGLPYSVLLKNGKRKQIWKGSVTSKEIEVAVEQHCKAAK